MNNITKMMFRALAPHRPGSLKNMKYATRLVFTSDGLGVVVKRALLTS